MTDPTQPPADMTESPIEFEMSDDDGLYLAIAKAEIRGALAALAGVDELLTECLTLAMEHELHDDLITGLTAISEDLRLHVQDNILPLRERI